MKNTIQKLAATVVALGLILGISTTANAGSYGTQQIAYHVNYDDPKRQFGALRNIQNHINAVGAKNLDLRVIMHGKGLSMLLLPEEASSTKLPMGNATDKQQATIANLKKQNVTFKVCANTLKGKKIDLDQLYDAESTDIVPSGVAEIAALQSQGFAYLRP
jgi:intracellular sulfur oxidation DsrE/DsrF family protein